MSIGDHITGTRVGLGTTKTKHYGFDVRKNS